MKKIIIAIILMLALNPVQAKDIKYINCLPYKEYKKEIKLKNINNDSLDVGNGITIIKNNYQFKYVCKKMGIPCEYIIVNNSDKNLELVGLIGSKKYFNRDLDRKHSKRIKPLAKAFFTTWYSYIPYVDVVMGGLSDIEKNKFIMDFPKNKIIKSGESLRILCIEMEKNSSLQFVFKDGILEF